jgi:transcriptional regulator with XRE-family HTH domain
MKMRVGNRLMVAREDRKYSQTEMANLLNLSQPAYSRLERNETSADIEQVVNFSKILQIPIQEFLPETFAIHNSNNQNAQVGFIIGNFYHYEDKQIGQEIELKNKELELLKKENELIREKVTHLEELLTRYKKGLSN